MLPKKHRLTVYDFRKNPSFIKKAYSDKIRLLVKNSRSQNPRIAFLVSKKTSKLSTKRNETKRVLGEAVKKLINEIKEKKDILIIANDTIEKRNVNKVEIEIGNLFAKAGLLKRAK